MIENRLNGISFADLPGAYFPEHVSSVFLQILDSSCGAEAQKSGATCLETMASQIDNRVSLKQCKLAATALYSHVTKKLKEREETELLPGKEENVWLVVAVKQASAEKRVKPHKM